MPRTRATMRQAIFYRLFLNRRASNEFIPVHGFMGELFIEPLSMWGYVSYECSARLSEINKNNLFLIERVMMTGKSGANFYGYRINPAATRESINDPDLLEFYDLIKDYAPNITQSTGATS